MVAGHSHERPQRTHTQGTYDGAVIDCDVHHEWASPDDLLPFLSAGWREFVTGPRRATEAIPGVDASLVPFSSGQMWNNPHWGYRAETYPPGGGVPGSDYSVLCDQLLDPNRTERALLHFESAGYVSSLTNPYFATEVARAANDWTIDVWLSRPDPRLYGAMVVATQDPLRAADEIRRVGSHPRIAEVLLVSTGLGKPFGHPAYHPIYAAAADAGLPIAIHAYGEVFPGHNVAPHASGMPSFYFEIQALAGQGLQTHLTSFIANGVFEKFPTLKLLIVEAGVAWMPSVMWRLDSAYRALRRELPWLKRFPSETIRDHVRLTTQPLELAPESELLVDVLRAFGGEDMLLFSTDYPHWDTDEKQHIARTLPSSWLPKVFRENAIDFFGWDELRTG